MIQFACHRRFPAAGRTERLGDSSRGRKFFA